MPLEAVLCTCGNTIGSLTKLFDLCSSLIISGFRAAKMPDVAIDRTQWDSKYTVEYGPLLDILQIKNECCRTTMLSKIKVSDIR